MYELYYALEACEEFDIYTPPVVPKKRISKRVSMVYICLLIKYVCYICICEYMYIYICMDFIMLFEACEEFDI
jgi:hypothetical protein